MGGPERTTARSYLGDQEKRATPEGLVKLDSKAAFG
jgi:hypothetical protein